MVWDLQFPLGKAKSLTEVGILDSIDERNIECYWSSAHISSIIQSLKNSILVK